MKDMNTRGSENEAKGAAKEVKGKVLGNIGDATDNASQHASGIAEELQGKAQKNLGKAERAMDPDNSRSVNRSDDVDDDLTR